MDYEELKQKFRPELLALAKEKRLKYARQMKKDQIIKGLILTEKFPKGWEDLDMLDFYYWLQVLPGPFTTALKDEFSDWRDDTFAIESKIKNQKCPHGRVKCICKDCGGSRICPHNKRIDRCRDCMPSNFCEHNRVKYVCKDCGGKGICPHGKQKPFCKLCGGTQICIHGRQRALCVPCGGSQICEHKRRKANCRECRKPETE